MLAIHPCKTVASTPLEPMQPAKDALKSKMTLKCSDTYAHFVTG